MIKLNCGVTRELKSEFVLDEDGIRRIVGVLEAKAKDLPYSCSVVFHVKREDDRFYETTRVEDVLADANTPKHRIEILGIELRNSDPATKDPQPWERDWIAAVQFYRNGGRQKIDISSEDRNWALLLADEIEPQVVRTFTPKKIPTWLLISLYFATATWLLAIAKATTKFAPFDIFQILKFVIWGGVAYLTIATLGGRDWVISRWAGPESSFNWGEQATSYSHRENLRQNLFWVVIMGFLVSVGASIYTNTLSPQTAEASSKVAKDNPSKAQDPSASVERDAPLAGRP